MTTASAPGSSGRSTRRRSTPSAPPPPSQAADAPLYLTRWVDARQAEVMDLPFGSWLVLVDMAPHRAGSRLWSCTDRLRAQRQARIVGEEPGVAHVAIASAEHYQRLLESMLRTVEAVLAGEA